MSRCIILIATQRSSVGSNARYTLDIPPDPTFSPSWYRSAYRVSVTVIYFPLLCACSRPLLHRPGLLGLLGSRAASPGPDGGVRQRPAIHLRDGRIGARLRGRSPARSRVRLAGRRRRARMPIDPRLWSERPIGRASRPAWRSRRRRSRDPMRRTATSVRVREGLMCHRRKLDTAEALSSRPRRGRPGRARFRVDLDVERDRGGVRGGPGGDSLRGRGAPLDPVPRPRRDVLGIGRGARYEEWRAAAIAAGAEPAGEARPDPLAALRRFGTAGHRRGRGGLRPLEPGGRDGAVAAGRGGACAARARC